MVTDNTHTRAHTHTSETSYYCEDNEVRTAAWPISVWCSVCVHERDRGLIKGLAVRLRCIMWSLGCRFHRFSSDVGVWKWNSGWLFLCLLLFSQMRVPLLHSQTAPSLTGEYVCMSPASACDPLRADSPLSQSRFRNGPETQEIKAAHLWNISKFRSLEPFYFTNAIYFSVNMYANMNVGTRGWRLLCRSDSKWIKVHGGAACWPKISEMTDDQITLSIL